MQLRCPGPPSVPLKIINCSGLGPILLYSWPRPPDPCRHYITSGSSSGSSGPCPGPSCDSIGPPGPYFGPLPNYFGSGPASPCLERDVAAMAHVILVLILSRNSGSGSVS